MNREEARWNNFLKFGFDAGAKFLWVCSVSFSMFGLLGILDNNASVQMDMLMTWFYRGVSLGLSAIVNLLELALNREDISTIFNAPKVSDAVLWLFGLLSYFYDFYTNLAGISLFMLGSADIFHIPFTALLIPGFFAFVIAVGPEPMYSRAMQMQYVQPYKQAAASAPQGNYGGQGLSREQMERLAALRQAQQNKGR